MSEFKKKSNSEKIKELQEMIDFLKSWKLGEKIPTKWSVSFSNITSEAQKYEVSFLLRRTLQKLTNDSSINFNGKLYLSEMLKKDNKDLSHKNILIIAPTGSGKTRFMHDFLKEKSNEKKLNVLMLVSTVSLKDSIVPENNEERKLLANRCLTSKRKTVYGEENYKIHVMSYAEFGIKVRPNNKIMEEFDYIFCDEFHSLIQYRNMKKSSGDLSIALSLLLSEYENKQIFYLTATEEHINVYKRKVKGSFDNVHTINYLDNNEIKRYVSEINYKFTQKNEILNHLRLRAKRFKYFGFKVLAFTRRIDTQLEIAEWARNEGFNPIVLWSINNKDSDKKLTKEQLEARDYLLKTGKIPEPYDFLIINSAMQEGWNLLDPDVNLVIMNTTNETEYVQASGRLRENISIILSKSKEEPSDNDKIEDKKERMKRRDESRGFEIFIPHKYLNVEMIKVEKDKMINELNFISPKGDKMKWQGLNSYLKREDSMYEVIDGYTYRNKKRVRFTKIKLKGEDEDNA